MKHKALFFTIIYVIISLQFSLSQGWFDLTISPPKTISSLQPSDIPLKGSRLSKDIYEKWSVSILQFATWTIFL